MISMIVASIVGGVCALSGLAGIIWIRQINEGERGVVLLTGKYDCIKKPGWRIISPLFHKLIKVDIRLRAVDVPHQEALTKDNISAGINAVIYYRVVDPKKAVCDVADYEYAVEQLAQTTMRTIVGEFDLDHLLQHRDQASEKIRSIVDTATDPWGIKVERIELKDITLPDDMKRVIGKQAEAERERRAAITRSEGEKAASQNIAAAARVLAQTPGGLHLRTLATISELPPGNATTFLIPVEGLEALKAISDK